MQKIKNSAENLIPTEIGVSKHCCHICFGRLSKKSTKIAKSNLSIPGYKKAQAGWRFPPGTPLDLQRRIIELVKKEVDQLRYFADSKRRSNSFPTADSGDEAIACDREIEVSPDDFWL